MRKFARNLLTVSLMGIPLWVILAGVFQSQPTSLSVHLEELNVRLFVNGREYSSNSDTLGPIELRPGDYEIVVTREAETLFSYPISLDKGHFKEVWAHWKTGKAVNLQNPGLQGVFRDESKLVRGKRG